MSPVDPISLLFQLGLGPWTFPCRGKIPTVDAWNTLPPVDEERVRYWIERCNYNLALRTGPVSGVVVIDTDQAKHPDGPQDFVLPPTGLIVASSTGSRHGYYRCPEVAPHNSVARLAPHVDVRGDGGYIMLPPSVHPETQQPYRWESTDAPGELPADVLAVLLAAPAAQPAPRPAPSGAGYADAALHGEVHRVRTASVGSRNDTLNRSAFSLGQLVGGGVLDGGIVSAELIGAATLAGLDEDEAAATVSSGMRAGEKRPRGVPERGGPERGDRHAPASPRADIKKPEILAPGGHHVEVGDFIRQGADKFSSEVLAALPEGAIYRRGGNVCAVGEIRETQFVTLSQDRLRSIVDVNVDLIRMRHNKETDSYDPTYCPCTRDNAGLILAFAESNGGVRTLNHITTYPVCAGPEFTPTRPGWNETGGVFVACDITPERMSVAEARAVMEDLVCDFPFATPADRANFFGLLLTVIMRPAIAGPVPMHMIGASAPGSGKGKLIEVILGAGVLGRQIGAKQLGRDESEREKKITGMMLSGEPVIYLDNLSGIVDSPALASVLTAARYSGRELGRSNSLDLPNNAVFCGTGNNVHVSDEIGRRFVPVILQSNTDAPQDRTDYRYPDLLKHASDSRPRLLGALFSLVRAWNEAGRHLGSVGFGSFERWSSVVGGVMAHAGMSEWCSNLSTWRGRSDDFGSELRAFVELWAAKGSPSAWTALGELYLLARENDLFDRKLGSGTDDAKKTAFGHRVMSEVANRVVSTWRIEIEGRGKRRVARLVAV